MSSNNDVVPGFDLEKDSSLRIRLQVLEGVDACLVLYLTGYIDTYNSNLFQKRVGRAIDAGYSSLIFHCGDLTYVSSTGIGSFTSFLKTLKMKNGDLVLLSVHPKVYEVFQLLGFAQFFNIKEDLESAIACLTTSAPTGQAEVFPKVFRCPICSRKLKASRSGRFRCGECRTILGIDATGQVFLG